MKQIKIFSSKDADKVTKDVNMWINENKHKKICNIKFSMAKGIEFAIKGVMIIYEEGGKK